MNNLRIEVVMPVDFTSKSGSVKYAVRVKTKGSWFMMARKDSKEPGNLLVFKRAQDRDRYMTMLMASFGPAVHEERLRMKKRIKREPIK